MSVNRNTMQKRQYIPNQDDSESDEEEVYEQGGYVDMGESDDEIDNLEEGLVNIKLKQGEMIQVEFEVFGFTPDDDLGIRGFVRRYCDSEQYDFKELAEILSKQSEVGSIIKDVEDLNLFGICTAIPLHLLKNHTCIQQIKKYLLARITDQNKKNIFSRLLEDTQKPLGLIINNRVENIPHEIAPPCHNALYQEISEISKKSKEWNFENYIMVCNHYRPYTEKPSKKKNIKKEAESFYMMAEDEAYCELADFSFTFPIFQYEERTKQDSLDFSLAKSRTIIAFSAKKVPQILKAISDLIPHVNTY